jgi:hypothetical protein
LTELRICVFSNSNFRICITTNYTWVSKWLFYLLSLSVCWLLSARSRANSLVILYRFSTLRVNSLTIDVVSMGKGDDTRSLTSDIFELQSFYICTHRKVEAANYPPTSLIVAYALFCRIRSSASRGLNDIGTSNKLTSIIICQYPVQIQHINKLS